MSPKCLSSLLRYPPSRDYYLCLLQQEWQGSHLIQVNQKMVAADFCAAHIMRAFKLKKSKALQMVINRRKPWGNPEERRPFVTKLNLRVTFLPIVFGTKDNDVVKLKIKGNWAAGFNISKNHGLCVELIYLKKRELNIINLGITCISRFISHSIP